MITLIAGFTLAAWVYLVFFHHDFWRADQRLPSHPQALAAWPSVTAIVPARNEAASIAACVDALRAQDYAGRFSVVVVDDASTDGTTELARAAGDGSSVDLTVLNAPKLEAGWTGKLWALNAGLSHVNGSAPPDFIWFTDADIVHAPGTLTALMSKAETDERDIVSLMVRLRCESFWERLLIPAFIFFFQMLYPFPAVNNPKSRMAAAAGGCVLIRRDLLIRFGGLAAIRAEIIDDCALAAAAQKAGGRLWLGLTQDSLSLRRAESLGPLWGMVRRTAFTQLGYSAVLLALTLLGLGLVFLAPAALVLTGSIHGQAFGIIAGLSATALMVRSYTPTLGDYGLSPCQALILPLAAGLYGAMTVASAVAHWRHRGGQWKGRHYGPSSGPANLSESP